MTPFITEKKTRISQGHLSYSVCCYNSQFAGLRLTGRVGAGLKLLHQMLDFPESRYCGWLFFEIKRAILVIIQGVFIKILDETIHAATPVRDANTSSLH